MRAVGEKVMRVLRELRGPDTSDAVLEATALLVGALFLILGFAIGFPVFWGREVPISGAGSVGSFAAYGGAATAVLAFTLGRIAARPQVATPDGIRDGFSIRAIVCGGTTWRPSRSRTRPSPTSAGSGSPSSWSGASPTRPSSRSPVPCWSPSRSR